MSVRVNLYFKINRLEEDNAYKLRDEIPACLKQFGLDGDVYDIQGVRSDSDGKAKLFFGNDWSVPLNISQAIPTLEKLEQDLKALASKYESDYGFEFKTEFPDNE
jgi:hypothetical protein